MLKGIIDFSLRNKFIVLLGTIVPVLVGVYSVKNIPLDALPDQSDVQVIVYTEWPGQAPDCSGSGHVSAHHEDALRAEGKGRSWLFVLRLFIRLCHFSGWH